MYVVSFFKFTHATQTVPQSNSRDLRFARENTEKSKAHCRQHDYNKNDKKYIITTSMDTRRIQDKKKKKRKKT